MEISRNLTASRRSEIALSALWLADTAVGALVDEAELTPKPALVDQRGSGAHVDLDLPLMLRSARTLQPAFAAMAQAAALHVHATIPTRARTHGEAYAQTRSRTDDVDDVDDAAESSAGEIAPFMPDTVLRESLGRLGREAERAMLLATAGANAHRGAIWVLGLLVAAAAWDEDGDAFVIAETAAAIARLDDQYAPTATTHGLRMKKRYGVTGARGEATSGFPHIIEVALPTLLGNRASGVSETHARLNALISIIARLDDTCLLHRGGQEALTTAQRGANRVLDAGGTQTDEGWQRLMALESDLLARNASPGGAADLLAATLFLDRIDVSRSTARLALGAVRKGVGSNGNA